MTSPRPNKQGNRRTQKTTSPPRKGPSRDNRVGAFDLSVRFLLQDRPQDFISFGLGSVPVQVLSPISEALPALGRHMDGGYLALLGHPGPMAAVHVELFRR